MQKLNQVIAVEKSIKSRTHSSVSELYHNIQKEALFNGFHKRYTPKDEEGERFSDDEKRVQLNVEESIKSFASINTELFDITATKDTANCTAKADIVVDGVVIAEQVPATYLLFLEKEINSIRTYFSKLPTLDTSENWTKDINSGLYKKEQRAIVLYEATKEHPAQTVLGSEDVVTGYWDTVKYSGAIPNPDKKEILEKIEKLAIAIKYAREEANTVVAENVFVGKKLFDYLLGGK